MFEGGGVNSHIRKNTGSPPHSKMKAAATDRQQQIIARKVGGGKRCGELLCSQNFRMYITSVFKRKNEQHALKNKKSNSWQEKAKVHSVAGSHFMALVLQQIYLDDVSGSNPAFSLVAFTTCLLKPPLCYRAADHNQNSLCEIEFTSGHTGLASWIEGSSPCTSCLEINRLQYCTFLSTEEPLKAVYYLF